MAAYIFFMCTTFGLTAFCVVAGRNSLRIKKERDDERRRRNLQNLRIALGD